MDAGTDPLLALLCAARNVKTAAELGDKLAQLLPYGDLKNIAAATERLARAIAHQERILIVADYDADGATACAGAGVVSNISTLVQLAVVAATLSPALLTESM